LPAGYLGVSVAIGVAMHAEQGTVSVTVEGLPLSPQLSHMVVVTVIGIAYVGSWAQPQCVRVSVEVVVSVSRPFAQPQMPIYSSVGLLTL